ncbi:DNA adenine methylase [Bacillus velezensis]|nr:MULTISPECIES: DNA adenine methylase [Bacillus amyloliquefaciens group]MCZ4248004.1 DNA adenine methylase [Bacillus amyloliquefaciens]MDX7894875.1 DNA adenine methylase [Bacillus velezensis]MDX8026292.1 DNA adenine methylase [Bacillus velezensis]MDX8199104.1 DNA adenine methylase [Bacillus velezensis]MDX8224874.1 DNA adenine methylase [Bacillus velezensis]
MGFPRILHYPGSKWSMTDWIISHMPEHKTYVEPFFGSGALFFNKQPSTIETINDLDSSVVNLFKVIRDHPEELARLIEWTPLSREEYYASYDSESGDEIEDARRFLIRCWQAIGAKTSDRTGWRSLISSNGPDTAKEWGKLPAKILLVAKRLKEAQIEHQPAVQLLERYKRKEVLVYADPPYIIETRTKRHYKHEMTIDDHVELLETLDKHPGPVLLSGYAHPIYDERLKHWKREIREVSAEAGAKRQEVLWINPVAAEQSYFQQSLFSSEARP